MIDRRENARTTLCAVACVTLALGGAVDPLFAPACFLFVLFKRTVLDPMRFSMPDLVFVLAHAMLFCFFLLFAMFNDLARDDLAVLLGFATLWMALRMFAEATPYNDFLIVLSSLVITVGSAAVAPGLGAVMITSLYLIAFCYALPVIMAARVRDEGVTVRLVGRARGWAVAGGFACHHLSLAGLLLGSIVYLAVPRVEHDPGTDAAPAGAGADLLAGRQARGGISPSSPTAVSGFPSSIRIGDIGAIKQSDRRAFDVWIRLGSLLYDPKPSEHTMLLLRADAWDTYDPATRSWKRWDADRSPLAADGTISEGPARLHYNVSLHGYDGRKLFVPQRARRVRCAVRPLFIDLLGRVSADRNVREYWVEADMPPVGEQSIGRLRPTNQARLTAVDEALRRALMPFAREIGIAPLPRPGQIRFVTQAIRSYFARNAFRYTLQLPPIPPGKDPVLAFLERREGHCELYATAACLFLRMAQIPARLAGGVRCAEPMEPGHYRARFRNAHAWVEIACKDVGFVAFDFTPGDSSAVASNSDWSDDEDAAAPAATGATGGGAGDARGFDWSDPFHYGHEQQQGLVRAVRSVFHDHVVPGIGVLLALLIGVAVSRRAVQPRRKRLTVHAPSGVARRTLSFYVKWLRRCAAGGHRRRSHQTPREFLATLPDELRADGRGITAKFESLRYGSVG